MINPTTSTTTTVDADDERFKKWNVKVHRELENFVREICCDTYTMWKIEYPVQGGGVRDFKWKWWRDAHAESNAGSDAVLQIKKKTNFGRDPNCAPWCS